MITLHSLYNHYKNGKTYETVYFCKIQINDVWEEAILYKNDEGLYFARTIDDFTQKFKKIDSFQ